MKSEDWTAAFSLGYSSQRKDILLKYHKTVEMGIFQSSLRKITKL